MYLALLVWLVLCSVIEVKGWNKQALLYRISFIWMLVAICFRFGQGTDYTSYFEVYINGDGHGEFLYILLGRVFRHFGFCFEIFIGGLGLFCMYCLHRVIKAYSPYPCLSLLIAYPVIYLTYFFSLIRQGVVIAFFLGFMLKWLMDGKTMKYLVSCLVCGLVHSVGWLLLPLCFLIRLKEDRLYLTVLLSIFFGIGVMYVPFSWLSKFHFGNFLYYIEVSRFVSFVNFMERTVWLFILMVVWMRVVRDKKDMEVRIFYKIILYSSIVVMVFMPWGTMAGRFSETARAVIVVFLPILCLKSIRFRKLLLMCAVAYSTIMTVKSINNCIEQAAYQNTNTLTYPYISVFNKEMVLLRRDGARILALDDMQ